MVSPRARSSTPTRSRCGRPGTAAEVVLPDGEEAEHLAFVNGAVVLPPASLEPDRRRLRALECGRGEVLLELPALLLLEREVVERRLVGDREAVAAGLQGRHSLAGFLQRDRVAGTDDTLEC